MSFMTKVFGGLITPCAAGGTAIAASGPAAARGPPAHGDLPQIPASAAAAERDKPDNALRKPETHN